MTTRARAYYDGSAGARPQSCSRAPQCGRPLVTHSHCDAQNRNRVRRLTICPARGCDRLTNGGKSGRQSPLRGVSRLSRETRRSQVRCRSMSPTAQYVERLCKPGSALTCRRARLRGAPVSAVTRAQRGKTGSQRDCCAAHGAAQVAEAMWRARFSTASNGAPAQNAPAARSPSGLRQRLWRGRVRRCHEIPREERQHVALDPLAHLVGVVAVVFLVAVRDAQACHRVVQLLVRGNQAVLRADIDPDGVVLQVRRRTARASRAVRWPPTWRRCPAAPCRPSRGDRDRAAGSSGSATMPRPTPGSRTGPKPGRAPLPRPAPAS